MHTSRQSSDASDPKIKLHTAVDNSTIVQYNIVYYVIVILFIAIIIYYCFCCLLVLLFIILLCYYDYLRQEVMFSLTIVSLFVSSFMQKKTTQPIFTKYGGRVAHGHGRNRSILELIHVILP